MASQIVEKVLGEAEKHGAKSIEEVVLLVGELTLLNHEQLRFSYNVLAKGTILEGSKLTINPIEAEVMCPECGFHGRPEYSDEPSLHLAPFFLCPRCGGPVKILRGRELIIKRIRMKI